MRTAIQIFVVVACAFGGAVAPSQAQEAPSIGPKLQPYIGCLNALTERAHDSEGRYKSWVKGAGPTGKERIVYGLYTISGAADCRKNVDAAAVMAPSSPDLEKAGATYAAAASALEPLLKQADDYYTQGNYKDDKMAGGKALHPRLVAAWGAFNDADSYLRGIVERLNDQAQFEQLLALEKQEGRKARYHVMNLMLKAKTVTRVESGEPGKFDMPKVVDALGAYEASVKAVEDYAQANPADRIGSTFIGASKDFLKTGKELMRRVRDKVPYSSGERMMLSQQGAGWMIEGSPPRFMRDYNQLVERYNSGARF